MPLGSGNDIHSFDQTTFPIGCDVRSFIEFTNSFFRYGISVHFKIYPVIYAPALFFFIGTRYTKWCSTNATTEEHESDKSNDVQDLSELKFKNSNREDVKFDGLVSLGAGNNRPRARRKFKNGSKASPKIRLRPNGKCRFFFFEILTT